MRAQPVSGEATFNVRLQLLDELFCEPASTGEYEDCGTPRDDQRRIEYTDYRTNETGDLQSTGDMFTWDYVFDVFYKDHALEMDPSMLLCVRGAHIPLYHQHCFK